MQEDFLLEICIGKMVFMLWGYLLQWELSLMVSMQWREDDSYVITTFRQDSIAKNMSLLLALHLNPRRGLTCLILLAESIFTRLMLFLAESIPMLQSYNNGLSLLSAFSPFIHDRFGLRCPINCSYSTRNVRWRPVTFSKHHFHF